MKLMQNITSAILKLWQGFNFVRNSPERYGPHLRHKIAISLMYICGLGVAAYATTSILSNSPHFGVLLERDGAMEMPSLIICPPKSRLYDHSFFWNRQNIQKLEISPKAVNHIAKAAKHGQLASTETSAKLKTLVKGTKAESMLPFELWKFIASNQYAEFKYDYSVAPASAGLYWKHLDVECWPSISALADSNVPRFYACDRMNSIWLTDDSYCLIFNNTGHMENHTHTGSHYSGINRIQMHLLQKDHAKYIEGLTSAEFANASCEYPYTGGVTRFLKDYFPQTTGTELTCYDEPDDVHPGYFRSWIGNVLTDEIQFDTVKETESRHGSYKRKYTVVPYKLQEKISKVCSPLLSESCQLSTLSEHWKFIIENQYGLGYNMLSDGRLWNAPDMKIDVLISGSTYFEVAYKNRYSGLQKFQVVGNMFGILVGASFFLLIKMALFATRFLKKKQIVGLVNVVQVLAIVILLPLAIAATWIDYKEFQETRRFRDEFNFDLRTDGIAYPKIWVFPRMMGWLNYSFIAKHQISWKLLTYITATAALQKPNNWIMKEKQFFFWDKETPPEIGYHYEFMEFPLQFVSENLYEKHMTEVEQEYRDLAKNLNIDPNAPSWNVLKELMIRPCSWIKSCIINGKLEQHCCMYFQQTCKWGPGPGSNGCGLRLMNEHLGFRQTLPGKEYGVRIVLDMNQVHRDFFPNIRGWNLTKGADGSLGNYWLDSYLLSYAKNCSVRHGCKYGLRDAAKWRAWRGIHFHLGDQVWGFNGYPGMWPNRMKWHGKIRRVERTELDYDEKNTLKCSNDESINSFQKYAFLANELINKRCECHICLPPDLGPVLNYTNCCTPKKAGRCLTDRKMSEQLCRKRNPDISNAHINFRQLQYAANLPQEAPIMPLLRNECDLDVLFFDKESSYYQDLKEFQTEKKAVFLPPCRKVEHLDQPAGTRNANPDPYGIAENSAEVTFYYDHIEQQVFRKRDLQNPWEMFSLFCGGLGILLGFTAITIFEFVIDFANIKWGNVRLGHVIAYYGLAKLTKRFGTDSTKVADKIHPQNNENLRMEDLENQSSENRVNLDVGNQNIVNGQMENVESGDFTWPQRSEKVANLFKLIIVAIGITAASLGCYQMTTALLKDSVEVEYQLKSSGIKLPSVAVCIDRLRLRSKNFDEAQRKLFAVISDCALNKRTNVNCHQVFSEFLISSKFYCIVAPQKHYLKNATMPILTVKVQQLQNAVQLWAGGIEEIVEGHINANIQVVKGVNLFVRFTQWEIQTDYVCGQDSNLACPMCGILRTMSSEFSSYCCMFDGLLSPNLTRNHKDEAAFCMRSLYIISLAQTENSELQNKDVCIVTVEPQIDAKHIVHRQQRRTASESFMLYAGYVDIFVGISVHNLFYTFAFCLTALGSYIFT